MASVDDSELRAFAADLTRAPTRVALGARGAVSKGALNIKNQLVSEMRSSIHFKGVAPGISYDLDAAGLTADIGPTKGGPGALANIAYFGSARGGGTVPDPRGALEAEIPHFEKALLDLGEESL